MRLWSTKEKLRKNPSPNDVTDRFCRVLETGASWGRRGPAASIGFYQMHRYSSDKSWRMTYPVIDFTLNTHFDLGQTHIYYDGSHCSLSLGFLHINWAKSDCKKCYSERNDVPGYDWSESWWKKLVSRFSRKKDDEDCN